MTIIACVAKNGEMMFNKRRCSFDRIVLEDIAYIFKDKVLNLKKYSEKLFLDLDVKTRVIDDPMSLVNEDIFFLEDMSFDEIPANTEKIILYRWDRVYPADVYFNIGTGFSLAECTKIKGNSHDNIKKEVYVKC